MAHLGTPEGRDGMGEEQCAWGEMDGPWIVLRQESRRPLSSGLCVPENLEGIYQQKQAGHLC